MSNYRYQLEKYRGRGTRHTCPQCHRKQSFTRYIDTHNNNIYINDNVGKCNRLDKCGYHYTPRQYFEDNPWKRDVVVEKLKMIGKFNISTSTTKPTPRPIDTIPEWIFERSRSNGILRSVQDHVIARLGTSRGNLKEMINEFKEIREFKERMSAPSLISLNSLMSALSLRLVRCPRRYAPRHDVKVSANESPSLRGGLCPTWQSQREN